MNKDAKYSKKRDTVKNMRTQLMAIILSLSLAICLLIGGLSCLQLYNTAIDGAETSTSVCADGYADAIQNAIDTFMSDVETAAYDSRVTDPDLSTEKKEAILSSLASKLGFISIGAADADGNTYNGSNISDREYFQNAINGNTYISSPVIRKTDSSIVLFVAAKINNDTDYNGVVYAALSNDTFSKMISEAKIGEKGYAFVLDKAGTIIAHKDAALVAEFINCNNIGNDDENAELAPLAQKMTAQDTGVENVTLAGEKKIIAYQPIEGTDGWSLAIVADRGEMLSSYYTNLKIIIGIGVLVLLIGAFISLLISNSISKPVSQLTRRVELLSQGDLKTPVPETRRKDEIFRLSDALQHTINDLNSFIVDIDNVLTNIANKNIAIETSVEYVGDFAPIESSLKTIISQLNEVMRNIKESANLVSVNANQVSEGSQALASGSTEQASAVEELSTTLESISNDIKDTASNASEAKMITQKASAAVDEGNQRMREMITSMDSIYTASNQISNIIKTIEDIAFQTNILALNASVEAARAGMAGKGFAVVAEEVKNLATKSAKAAQNTSALINTAIVAVESGDKTARLTEESLNEIVNSTMEAGKRINDISQKAENQSQAIEQVTAAIRQIADVIQTNTANSEESAAASQELSSQAHILNEHVSGFMLK